MDHADSTPPWYAPWRQAARPDPADDPAGLGTAFGLDLSMPQPPSPALPTPPTGGSNHTGRWVLRLAARRRTAR